MSTSIARRVAGFGVAAFAAVVSLLPSAAPAQASSAGMLFAVYGESNIVKLDPATGAHPTFATSATGVFGDLVSYPAAHTLYS